MSLIERQKGPALYPISKGLVAMKEPVQTTKPYYEKQMRRRRITLNTLDDIEGGVVDLEFNSGAQLHRRSSSFIVLIGGNLLARSPPLYLCIELQ